MKTQLKNLFVAIAVTCIFGSAGFAQDIVVGQQFPTVPAQGQEQPQAYVQPQVQPYVQPIQQNPFYFGMQVELKNNRWGRTTLRVVGVTPGSPAQQAGLEFGDEIRTVNGRGFRFATDSFHAVRMVNQYVSNPVHIYGGPAPAAPAATALTIAPYPSPSPMARMVVRNVRNGQDVSVTVYPSRVGNVGAPAAAAAVSAGG